MKRFLPVCLILGFLLMLKAWPTAPMPLGNGDVNADGVLDLSDAVYLLTHIFRNGPEPVACADSPELIGRVEALEGVTTTIADSLADIAVALEGISNGVAELGDPCKERLDRFVDNGDETVTDTCTGLMWQRTGADINGNGVHASGGNPSDQVDWQTAVDFCNNLDFAGHTDWRLPSVEELSSIIAEGGLKPRATPAIGVESLEYWTSTTSLLDPGSAWTVHFRGYDGVGDVNPSGVLPFASRRPIEKSNSRLVIAVRGP